MEEKSKKYVLSGLFLVVYLAFVYLNVQVRAMSIHWIMVVFCFLLTLPILLIAVIVDRRTDSERARKLGTIGLSLIYIVLLLFWIFNTQYGESSGNSMLLGVWLAFPFVILWALYREVKELK